MRGLLVAVVVMGVLIVAGVATIAVTVVSRMSSAGGAGTVAVRATLDEPEGTHITGLSVAADRVAVQLQGGGADRVVVLETRTGHVIARIALAR